MANTDQFDLLPIGLGQTRKARKAHRCTCADPLWPNGGLNPDYRPNCLGDIRPGDRYWEYMGETPAYQSGTPYCRRCAVAVWTL